MCSTLLESLLKVSEKAANIARVCRQDQHLFELLVQEKTCKEKNPRFVQDFKTLADVLIQETVKHDIGLEFIEMANHIYGEETNSFVNILGESINVRVTNSREETVTLLSKVLDGDETAAELLATEVHRNMTLGEVALENPNLPSDLALPLTDMGLWIDPIDSTMEYISGEESVGPVNGIHIYGLNCVTVLIGLFDRTTGHPVAGVINQPFHTRLSDLRWQGSCEWGVSYGTRSLSSLPPGNAMDGRVVVLSCSESPELKARLSKAGYQVAEAAGAGYKQLCVVRGLADFYLLTKGSTFFWDTCGPHAVLSALGGVLLDYSAVFGGRRTEVSYSVGPPQCNVGGILAARNVAAVDALLETLRH